MALFVAMIAVRVPGRPFCGTLDGLLADTGFDGFCEDVCAAT